MVQIELTLSGHFVQAKVHYMEYSTIGGALYGVQYYRECIIWSAILLDQGVVYLMYVPYDSGRCHKPQQDMYVLTRIICLCCVINLSTCVSYYNLQFCLYV